VEFLSQFNAWVMSLAESPWALVAVFAVAVIDGFFPPIPSETLVIAAASLFAQNADWTPGVKFEHGLLLALVAAAGALCGDCTAYTFGRVFNATEWRIFRSGKGQAAFAWADRTFRRTGASLLMVARFIPVGRVAVNLTAGAIKYSRRRFVMIDSFAALFWGTYSTGIGFAAGKLVEQPLLGVAVGIVFAVVVGSVVQHFLNRRFARQDAAEAAALAAAGEAGGAVPDDAR
jgi:membrane protein DedA with SNARE-associated domain